MKKLLILFLIMAASAAFGQSPTLDTIRFRRAATGKLWELITYGNSDSLKINGQVFYTNWAGEEVDPQWVRDSSYYPPKEYADNRYEFKIADDFYMCPDSVDYIQGAKTFWDGKLILRSATAARTQIGTLAVTDPDDPYIINFPDGSGTVALTRNISQMTRYSAYSSGANNVEVLADSIGITATLTSTNVITFTIPAGVKLISAKIRVENLATLDVLCDTDDMANSALTNRWMPLVQGWREDTGQQLMGLTTRADLSNHQKITVNGLINTTTCQIRLSF